MDLNGILLCACGAAYNIDPTTGDWSADDTYSPQVNYTVTQRGTNPQAFAAASIEDGPLINACLVGYNANQIIVAFRGTVPSDNTPAGIEDWLQDFFAEPANYDNLPGKVHEGFYTALTSIYPQIKAAVQALKAHGSPAASLPVYVTGHSKGGGMAPLAAYLLNGAGVTIEQVVTFAGPKPGDATFQAAYDSAFANHLRYENYGDLVPLLPPSDDFITLIANALWYVSEDLYDLMEEAVGWNYQAVGSEAYIESANLNYGIVADEDIDEQVSDFIWNLGANYDDPGTALWQAHTIEPGFGYVNGVCPSLSTSS